MTENELRTKMTQLKEQNGLILIKQRKCMKADKEGLKKIIVENNRISCIEIIPINPPWLSFSGCNDSREDYRK